MEAAWLWSTKLTSSRQQPWDRAGIVVVRQRHWCCCLPCPGLVKLTFVPGAKAGSTLLAVHHLGRQYTPRHHGLCGGADGGTRPQGRLCGHVPACRYESALGVTQASVPWASPHTHLVLYSCMTPRHAATSRSVSGGRRQVRSRVAASQ